MSSSRAKRPFAGAAADPAQRQITSFFTKTPEGGGAFAQSSQAPLQGPVIPPNIQANLLTVGMRIRKAVPEGYKMGNATSAFKLWTDTATTAPRFSAPEANPAAVPHATPQHSSSMAIRVTRSANRELLPFCGINKIGGMAAQPEYEDDDDDEYEDVPALDDVPEFTISQESADSYVCEPSRKRGFDGDEESRHQHDAFDPDAQWAQAGDNARVIALPRTRAKGSGQDSKAADDDFEEASFLVFGDGLD